MRDGGQCDDEICMDRDNNDRNLITKMQKISV